MESVYDDPEVRRRMAEFLGVAALEDLEEARSAFLVGYGPTGVVGPAPPSVLPEWLDRGPAEGLEIRRSLWDHGSLVVTLDFEQVNFDCPAEPYRDPRRTFALLEPAVAAAREILAEHGIPVLHLVSGRGHHLLWRVRRGSRAFARLASSGQVAPRVRELYARPYPPAGDPVPRELGAAYAAAGLVMELVAHRIKRKAAPRCDVPVEITQVAVGPRERGREMVSIDLSRYADPLGARTLLLPFSLDRRPQQLRPALAEDFAPVFPAMYLVPVVGGEVEEAFAAVRDPAAAVRLARRASCQIPDAAEGMERLMDYYRASSLSQFHNWFYAQEPQPPGEWGETYEKLAQNGLPPCARTILDCPGGLLLDPRGIERLTRVLLALGWHPRHIAGLVRARSERAGSWGEGWNARDPGSHADFYVRLFAGLFVAGTDDLVSFNCQSAKEAGFCFHTECSFNLLDYRGSLLERRAHGRLARRPVDRLLLPDEAV